MSYLTANGLVLPIAADSLRVKPIDVGGRDRLFSGDMAVDVRFRKRQLNAELAITDSDTLALIRTIINGEFDCFSQSTGYSDKGAVPTTGSRGATIRSTGADTLWMSDGLGALRASPFTYKAGYGFWVNPAVPNLLTANQSSVETDTTGFAAYGGASISRVADRYHVSTHSLKVEAASASQGVTISRNTSASGYHSALACVTGNAGVKVKITLANTTHAANQTGRTTTVTLSPDKWTAIDALACNASNAADTLVITIQTVDAGGIFYVDSVSLYAGTGVVPWVVGGSSSAAWATPAYAMSSFSPTPLSSLSEFSIMGWVCPAYCVPATYAFGLLSLNTYSSANHAVKIENVGTTRALKLFAKAYGTEITMEGAQVPADADGWMPFCLSVTAKARTGLHLVNLYVNNVLDAYADPAVMFLPGLLTSLIMGHSGAGIIIDGWTVISRALTLAQYNLLVPAMTAREWSLAPMLRFSGDAIAGLQPPSPDGNAYMYGHGQLSAEQQKASRANGVWRTDSASADLTIDEY